MLQLALWFVTVWGIGREMMMCLAVSVIFLQFGGSEGPGDVCCC